LRSTTENSFRGAPSALGQTTLCDNIDLLCEYLANPFGNAQQAREFLSLIEDRSLCDAELERGEFCFQIAFYFLARLAITAHVQDSLTRTSCTDRLDNRVRELYDRTSLRARFSDFIVASAERDQFGSQLREFSERAGDQHPDISRLVTTKLGMFDLVGLRRLREYRAVTGPLNYRVTFYLVAEQVLLHFGGKKYHPAAVAVIADFLSVNYNILSKILLAGLSAVDLVQTGREETGREETEREENPCEEGFDCLFADRKMPDVSNKPPSRIFKAGNYVLLLVENVVPMDPRLAIRFRYVLVVCDRQDRRPVCFVTLEDSPSISNVLCVFEVNGSHWNYGALTAPDLLAEFMDKAILLVRRRFAMGEIEDLSRQAPSHRSWWKFLPRTERKRGGGRSTRAVVQAALPNVRPGTGRRLANWDMRR
jgi:hypothetical protein